MLRAPLCRNTGSCSPRCISAASQDAADILLQEKLGNALVSSETKISGHARLAHCCSIRLAKGSSTHSLGVQEKHKIIEYAELEGIHKRKWSLLFFFLRLPIEVNVSAPRMRAVSGNNLCKSWPCQSLCRSVQCEGTAGLRLLYVETSACFKKDRNLVLFDASAVACCKTGCVLSLLLQDPFFWHCLSLCYCREAVKVKIT